MAKGEKSFDIDECKGYNIKRQKYKQNMRQAPIYKDLSKC